MLCIKSIDFNFSGICFSSPHLLVTRIHGSKGKLLRKKLASSPAEADQLVKLSEAQQLLKNLEQLRQIQVRHWKPT